MAHHQNSVTGFDGRARAAYIDLRETSIGEDMMSRLVGIAFLMLVLTMPAAPAPAASLVDELDQGPKVGQPIPHTLKAPDQNDQYRDFKSLARKRGLIVLFSRSLGW